MTASASDLQAYAAKLVAQFGHRLGNPDWDTIVEMRDEGEDLTDAEVDEVYNLWQTAVVTVARPALGESAAASETPPPAEPDVAGALAVASDCAMYDGDHHKMWVIDQMVRHLTGCPTETRTATDVRGVEYSYETLGESEAYRAFVDDDEDHWDAGIAP